MGRLTIRSHLDDLVKPASDLSGTDFQVNVTGEIGFYDGDGSPSVVVAETPVVAFLMELVGLIRSVATGENPTRSMTSTISLR